MIDVEKVLDKLNELGYIRLNRITGDYYSIYCPIHNNGQERKPSCGVLLHDVYKNGQLYPAGWVHCFSCGYAKTMPDFITDLLQQRNMTGTGIAWLQEYVPGFDGSNLEIEPLIPNAMVTSLYNSFAVGYVNSFTQKKQSFVPEEELAGYRFTVPYMYQRHLNDWAIEKYDVGFDANHVPPGRKKALPCITFPVRDINGNTLFLCRRSIEGKYFNYPEGVVKPLYGIYELPSDVSTVVICESCINAITASMYGYPAVALLGTGNSYQLQQLRELGVRSFVICLDGDDAGKRGTAKLKKALSSVAIVWTITMPSGKDINDCTKEEFDELYACKE